MLQSMELQRVGHDLTTEQQHSELLNALNSRFYPNFVSGEDPVVKIF